MILAQILSVLNNAFTLFAVAFSGVRGYCVFVCACCCFGLMVIAYDCA